MRILNFGDRAVSIDFSPENVDMIEQRFRNRPMALIFREVLTLGEWAKVLGAVSRGAIKDKEDFLSILPTYETGYKGLLEDIDDEMNKTGWLGVMAEQKEDETGKN